MMDTSTLAMIALYPDIPSATRISALFADDPDAYAAHDLHATIVFLGEIADLPTAGLLRDMLDLRDQEFPLPVTFSIAGTTMFDSQDGGVGVLLVDGPGLAQFYTILTVQLDAFGIQNASEHGFLPHISVLSRAEAPVLTEPLQVTFDRLVLTYAGTKTVLLPENYLTTTIDTTTPLG